MRTIRECICDSTEMLEFGTIPICLSYFIKNMAVLLVIDAHSRLLENFPDVSLGSESFEGEEHINPSIDDAISVLLGKDLLRGLAQFAQLQAFLNWFLEQNEPDENEPDVILWYEMSFVASKWNEYALKRLKEAA